MKLMFFKHLNPLVLAACGFVFATTSCSKVEDLYTDPSNGGTSNLFPIGTVSDSFTWSTAKAVDIRIAVDDEFDGKYSYKLEVYDSEPDAEGSMLLAAGLAKTGKDLITKATVPTALENLFVKQTSPTGLVSYFMVNVNGSSASNVGAIDKVAAVNSKGLNLLASTSATGFNVVTIAALPNLSSTIEYNNSTTTTVPNGSYVILESTTVTNTSGLTAGNKLYIKGVWDLSASNVVLPAGIEIVVMPEGKIKNSLGKKITLSAGSTLTNFGTLDINGTLELVGGIFTNNEKTVINVLDVKSIGKVINNDRMTINEASFVDSYFEVFCNTTVKKSLFMDGSTTYVARGANLTVLNENSNTRAKGSSFELDESAVFQANGLVEFEESSKRINSIIGKGSSNKKALASMKEVRVKSSKGRRCVDYLGNLNVASNKHDKNGRYNTHYYCGPKVKKYDRCDDFEIIVEPGCNGGGSVPVVPNPPTEPPPLTEVALSPFTYSFEDNWPTALRDFDVNDFVVEVQIVKYQDANNKVKKVVVKNKITSVGASKKLAAAIQLEGVGINNIADVDYADGSVVGNVLPLGTNGLEEGQSKPVLTIVDDAHAAFGVVAPQFVNTRSAAFQPFETEIVIEFNTALDHFSYDNLNPFIAYFDKIIESGRYEVHMVGSAGTDKLKTRSRLAQQGIAGELHASDMFKTIGNLPFAVCTPGSFVYPNESKYIGSAYSRFENWVQSNDTQDRDWYLGN